ncbi:hypothetical protein [Devosia chinhatensis]|uniref:Uncharacterized protein n=1 Tax=Devosia chinhatensis TaxID=429727 RepID=A0A0F5FLD6_9HYPH|nr:hypothetical protein [Devosia chinhatensis]KKB09603.1 hypothetical protein VE26_06875 [Devosia chinhatensis]
MDALAQLRDHVTDLVGGLEALCEIYGILNLRATAAAAGPQADALEGVGWEDLAVLFGLLPFTPRQQ